jgi:hypothetical protein
MLNIDLKENLKGNVSFAYYRDSNLWYRTATGMLFPVPVSDLGTSQLLAVEKSTVLMRWIRKYIAQMHESPDK